MTAGRTVSLFLSPRGRIGGRAYGLGLLAVLVFGFGCLFLPESWALLCLAFAWPKLCLHIQRLHDVGQPSSALIVPIVGNLFAAALSFGILLVAMSSGGIAVVRSRSDESISALIALAVVAFLWLGGNVAWVIRLMLRPGDPGPNPYGAAPAQA